MKIFRKNVQKKKLQCTGCNIGRRNIFNSDKRSSFERRLDRRRRRLVVSSAHYVIINTGMCIKEKN